MKAILKYPGAKWRLSEWIIEHFPEHKVYCEPFFGSGGVFFNKEPAYIETINDIDGNIVNLFRVCREYPEELAKLIEMTPFARDEFKACYEISADPIEQARRTLVRFHQSFGTSNSSKNSWRNVQTYGGPRCATMWNCLPDIILNCCEKLQKAGFNQNKIHCYVLSYGKDRKKDEARAIAVYEAGAMPFVQLYRDFSDTKTEYSSDWNAWARMWQRPAATKSHVEKGTSYLDFRT